MRKIILAALLSLLAMPAYAACTNPIIVTPGSGSNQGMSVTTGADGNCQSNLNWDLSSQPHVDIISPPTLGSITGGWTAKLLNNLGTTVIAVKNAAGQVGLLYCYNPNVTVTYIQMFNALNSAVTLGTTVPAVSYAIPPTNSGGYSMPLVGLQFASAVSIAATTTATGNGAPASNVDCNVFFN